MVICVHAVCYPQLNKDSARASGLPTTDRMLRRDVVFAVFRSHVVFLDCHACRLMSSICDGDTIRQPLTSPRYLAPAYFACGNAGMSQHGCAAIELWIDGNEAVVYGQGGAVGIGRAAGRGELNKSWSCGRSTPARRQRHLSGVIAIDGSFRESALRGLTLPRSCLLHRLPSCPSLSSSPCRDGPGPS